MIDRRNVLLGGVLIVAAAPLRAALPPVPGNRLGFDIIRKGTRLGSHQLVFERDGDALLVRVTVDLVVKLGFITLYRYSHRATEHWQGDQVVALQTSTNDDGDLFEVTARRDASGLAVQGTKAPRYIAPADALPATHWNRRELDGPWINTQDGRLMRPKVTPQGIDAIPTAAGGSVRASHFGLSGDVQLDMWYDARPSWAGLSFKAKDGSLVRYERL